MANGFDCANQNDDVDDVLMTPVLNTPKSIDIWPEKKLPEDNHNSPGLNYSKISLCATMAFSRLGILFKIKYILFSRNTK